MMHGQQIHPHKKTVIVPRQIAVLTSVPHLLIQVLARVVGQGSCSISLVMPQLEPVS